MTVSSTPTDGEEELMHPGCTPVTLPRDVARTVRETAIACLLHPFSYRDAAAEQLLPVATGAPGHRISPRRTPVVLVHGYCGTGATWATLERRLRGAGFTDLHTMTYSPFVRCVPDIGRALVRECHAAMHRAGTDRVHLIGHSLGGVVLRYAVHHLGLEPHVRTAVTVASPHRGTLAALFGAGEVVASLRPGSRLLDELRRGARASGVRWVSYYSDRDLVVRPYSSRLDEPALGATNVLVPGVGHLGIVRAPLFLASVVHLLGHDSVEQPSGLPATVYRRRADAAA
ncbi:MAG TPA: alpha/beta fold hydrolase [Geodermatophilus sp.]|nr:alpha/beta fold hydrolase [Geodermatophilus sp.]